MKPNDIDDKDKTLEFNTNKINRLRDKRVASYQETNSRINSGSSINSKRSSNKNSKPLCAAKNPPVLSLTKAKSDMDLLTRINLDQHIVDGDSPSSKIKTPLPTSTCSKRLNSVKESLAFSKNLQRANSLKREVVRKLALINRNSRIEGI